MLLLIGALAAAGEFHHRSIVSTYLITPRRGRVLAAKLIAHASLGAAVAAAGVAISFPIVLLMARGDGLTVASDGHLAAVAVAIVAAGALASMCGVAIGSILRHQTAAIVVILVWSLLVEKLLGGFFPPVLPFGAIMAAVGMAGDDGPGIAAVARTAGRLGRRAHPRGDPCRQAGRHLTGPPRAHPRAHEPRVAFPSTDHQLPEGATMTTTAPEDRASRSTGRVIATTAGWTLAALAVTFVILGGALIGIHETKRDAHGFYATGKKTLQTPTHALVADKLDANGPGWLLRESRLGTIRIQATGSAEKPVFVGVAKTAQIDSYLRGVAQDEVADFDVDPFSVEYERRAGSATPGIPSGQSFWASKASGSGRQTLTWPVEKGNWGVVIMNADGSAGVRTGVSIGARTSFMIWAGAALAATGLLFGAAAAACFLGGRPPRRRSPAFEPRAGQPVTQ